MRRTLAWIAGALGLAGAYRALKRQQPATRAEGPDPRAEELRRRLADAAPPEPVPDPAPEPPSEPVPDPLPDPVPETAAGAPPESHATEDPESKRRDVHERARAAMDEMRRPD